MNSTFSAEYSSRFTRALVISPYCTGTVRHSQSLISGVVSFSSKVTRACSMLVSFTNSSGLVLKRRRDTAFNMRRMFSCVLQRQEFMVLCPTSLTYLNLARKREKLKLHLMPGIVRRNFRVKDVEVIIQNALLVLFLAGGDRVVLPMHARCIVRALQEAQHQLFL